MSRPAWADESAVSVMLYILSQEFLDSPDLTGDERLLADQAHRTLCALLYKVTERKEADTQAAASAFVTALAQELYKHDLSGIEE